MAKLDFYVFYENTCCQMTNPDSRIFSDSAHRIYPGCEQGENPPRADYRSGHQQWSVIYIWLYFLAKNKPKTNNNLTPRH